MQDEAARDRQCRRRLASIRSVRADYFRAQRDMDEAISDRRLLVRRLDAAIAAREQIRRPSPATPSGPMRRRRDLIGEGIGAAAALADRARALRDRRRLNEEISTLEREIAVARERERLADQRRRMHYDQYVVVYRAMESVGCSYIPLLIN